MTAPSSDKPKPISEPEVVNLDILYGNDLEEWQNKIHVTEGECPELAKLYREWVATPGRSIQEASAWQDVLDEAQAILISRDIDGLVDHVVFMSYTMAE